MPTNPSLLLNVFQFAIERAPVVVALTRPRESCCPESVSPFPTPTVTSSCACP